MQRVVAAGPHIRRAQTKVFWKYLREQAEFAELREGLEAVIDGRALERGSGLGWVHLRQHCGMLRLVEAQVGEARYLEMWRESFQRSLDQRFLANALELLRPALERAVLLPFRRFPHTYSHFTRECGTCSVADLSESSARLEISNFPGEHGTRVWALTTLGAAQATASALGHPVDHIALEACDETAGYVSLTIDARPGTASGR